MLMASPQWMFETDLPDDIISNSLKFEDGDSPVLTRTPSSDGNKRTWTWSCWFKMANIIDTSGNVESTLMTLLHLMVFN